MNMNKGRYAWRTGDRQGTRSHERFPDSCVQAVGGNIRSGTGPKLLYPSVKQYNQQEERAPVSVCAFAVVFSE